MNPQLIETFSGFGVRVLCLALGVMLLAVFFTVLSRLGNGGAKPETMAVRGVLKKDTWAAVHMSGEETFERVRESFCCSIVHTAPPTGEKDR